MTSLALAGNLCVPSVACVAHLRVGWRLGGGMSHNHAYKRITTDHRFLAAVVSITPEAPHRDEDNGHEGEHED